MNAEILIKYEMNSEELFIWNAFCEKKLQCSMMQMPDISKEIIDKKLMIREPFFGNRGYSKKYGYYEVQEGGRGHLYLELNTFDAKKAVCVFLSCIAHDVGYQYVIKNKKLIEKMNVPKWHYYNEYTIVDNGSKCESKRIINSTGSIYDSEYDYRKYWFELTISYLAKVYDNLSLLEEIKKYQEYMNHQFKY